MSPSTAHPPPAPQLLLLADVLEAEGLRVWIEQDPSVGQVILDPDALEHPPRLVVWNLADRPEPSRLAAELSHLQERWLPAPVLLLLPASHSYSRSFLLGLPVQGLLEAPDAGRLREGVTTLLAGGRVLDLIGPLPAEAETDLPVMGLGGWLLATGLQQIDGEVALCRRLLTPPPENVLSQLLLLGRQRELLAARQLLLWLWGPLQMAWGPFAGMGPHDDPPSPSRQSGPSPQDGAPVAITLRQRTADGIWDALHQRLSSATASSPRNLSGQLMALEGLHPQRRTDLLLALLEQLELLREHLLRDNASLPAEDLQQQWEQLQPELRRQAMRRMAGAYVQLPCDGGLRPVADTLLERSPLTGVDGELPDPKAMLSSLIEARPLLVEGSLLAPDEPRAVLYLEMLLTNWLVRTAELISADVLAACADWPELRRYLLRPDLLPTRNLERLRNQLNAQQRWISWVERPVELYESRRPLFRLEGDAIRCIDITEPRDDELRRLGWPQQLVTLALEARDALGPQVRNLVRGLGDLVVVVLTRVLGRAIGLVGRGIMQGMGRTVGRN